MISMIGLGTPLSSHLAMIIQTHWTSSRMIGAVMHIVPYYEMLEKVNVGMLPDWVVCLCLIRMLPVYNRPRLFVDTVLHVPHPRAIEVGRTCTA